MLTLTLGDLVMSEAPLQRLVEKEIPATIAYQLARIVRQINPELRDYSAAQMALLKRVGTLAEDETEYNIEPKHQAEFTAEIRALLDAEIELGIVPIAEDDLPNLSAADAMALWWLVREPEDAGEER